MIDRTDEETVDLIRQWLRQYGLVVVGGLALGIAGVLGYEWWKSSRHGNAQQEAQALAALRAAVDAGNKGEADKIFAGFANSSGEMADMASLLLAKAHVDQQDYAGAQPHFHKASASKDALIAQSAGWYLAQLAARESRWDDVLAQTQNLQASIYAVPALQLSAVAHRAKNEPDKALAALENAYSRAADPFLQMQIQALKSQLMVKGKES